MVKTALDKVQDEIAVMKKLDQANLLKLHEVIDAPDENRIFTVLEYVQLGPVMDWDPAAHAFVSPVTRGVLDERRAAGGDGPPPCSR